MLAQSKFFTVVLLRKTSQRNTDYSIIYSFTLPRIHIEKIEVCFSN